MEENNGNSSSIYAYDLAGNLNYVVNPNSYNGQVIGDLDMREDGRLFAYTGINNNTNLAGQVVEVNPGNGGICTGEF